MSNKHTPGPWFIDHASTDNDRITWIDDELGVGICDFYHKNAGRKFHVKENVEANACLIVTAPELLKALHGLLEMHNLHMTQINHASSCYNAECIRLLNEAPIAARKAIAKAEGKDNGYS